MRIETPDVRVLVCRLGSCLAPASSADAAEGKRPNIVFFLTGDQPQVGLGSMGNRHIQTPNMDRLAAEGVLFTNAFVTTSICDATGPVS